MEKFFDQLRDSAHGSIPPLGSVTLQTAPHAGKGISP
jgi:hypothetical protein